MERKKAIVLLSGGLDSAVAMWLAKSQGYEVYALSFSYGQRHSIELEKAKTLVESAKISGHRIVDINMGQWGGSSLTDMSMNVEEGDIHKKEIPQTYVPARNLVFLSVAASMGEAIEAYDIFIGVSEVDYSGYVDCRQSFIDSMESTINMGTVAAVEEGKKFKIHAPFVYKTKVDEIIMGMDLGVDFANTWSCYKGEGTPCGVCDSCKLRAEAFRKAGYSDPAI
ncbi:7-cyano-7-deazaguanine synthase QueC [Halosquirtibacter laminarini]|uniref:7-cyano-7-deazaguanine synthase QueC n=1 Tax=Halosquirtibacter laminarini TaxID=3374600 RepID=A0AC61NK03_9BACT|nr:7-cyano-7-deazaguanine synthase QueC [Prolixibacteraceae bacterium]